MTGNAAGKINQETNDQFSDRSDEAGTRLRDEHAGTARRGDVDVADVDGAAHEGDELPQPLEHFSRAGRLSIQNDEVATRRSADEGFSLQERSLFVENDVALPSESRQRARAVIELHRLRRMRQQYLQAAWRRSLA